jgi:hypothetical protein
MIQSIIKYQNYSMLGIKKIYIDLDVKNIKVNIFLDSQCNFLLMHMIHSIICINKSFDARDQNIYIDLDSQYNFLIYYK